MTADLNLLLASTILCWLMLLAASLYRARGWTAAGMRIAFGNRDNLPEPTPMAGRADRAAKNMLENLLLFAVLLLAAHAAGKGSDPRLVSGAQWFFWARLAYAPIYWAGVAYLRTVTWLGGIIGMALVLMTIL